MPGVHRNFNLSERGILVRLALFYAMPAFDWTHWERTLEDAATSALQKILEKGSKKVYAVAFYEFYREEMGTISLPWLGANTLEFLSEEDEDTRWSPPEWRYSETRYSSRELQSLHRAMVKYAAEKEHDHWQQVHDRFLQSLVNVSRALREKFKGYKNVTSDFVVVVLDEEGDDFAGLLRQCLSPSEFRKLFPDLAAEASLDKASGSSANAKKLAAYRKDLWGNTRKILAMGEASVPMLMEALEDSEDSSAAADILGQLGMASVPIISALRKIAASGAETGFHHAGALSLLGDHDFVLDLAKKKKTRTVAIRGLATLYSSAAEDAVTRIPLDYGPAERMLKAISCDDELAEEMNGTQEIQAEDVEAALTGLESPHKAIRLHAVGVLGNRSLGKGASARIVPALTARLEDKSADVRRVAAAGLAAWGKLAKESKSALLALTKDPNAKVRAVAVHAAKEVG